MRGDRLEDGTQDAVTVAHCAPHLDAMDRSSSFIRTGNSSRGCLRSILPRRAPTTWAQCHVAPEREGRGTAPHGVVASIIHVVATPFRSIIDLPIFDSIADLTNQQAIHEHRITAAIALCNGMTFRSLVLGAKAVEGFPTVNVSHAHQWC